MIFRTKEAQEEYERNERVNRILEGGGCWITYKSFDGKQCLGTTYQGEKGQGKPCCDACEAYQEYYKCVESYKSSPDVLTWQEAIWLADQFFDIKTPYMCNGFEEEWCKEHDPRRYKEALKRQQFLMDGRCEENLHESEENLHESEENLHESNGQMTIMDWFKEAEG